MLISRKLNTSRIGANLVPGVHLRRANPLALATAGAALSRAPTTVPKLASMAQAAHSLAGGAAKPTAVLHSAGQGLVTPVENDLTHAAADLAKTFGLYDFYSSHILNYCEGYFVPGPVPNATVSRNSISKNVVDCSHVNLLGVFDPQSILQQQLSAGGLGLADLDWPTQMSTGLDALSKAQHAMKWLYVATAGFTCLALAMTAVQICLFGKVVMNFPTWLAESAGLLTLGIASGLVTAFAVGSTKLINALGQDLGVCATVGVKFLALTWAAVVAMLIAVVF